MSVERRDALAAAGGKIVEDAHFAARGGEGASDVGAEEAGAAGDENFGSVGEHFRWPSSATTYEDCVLCAKRPPRSKASTPAFPLPAPSPAPAPGVR